MGNGERCRLYLPMAEKKLKYTKTVDNIKYINKIKLIVNDPLLACESLLLLDLVRLTTPVGTTYRFRICL